MGPRCGVGRRHGQRTSRTDSGRGGWHSARLRDQLSLPGLRHHDDRHLGRVDPLGNHSGRVSLRGIRPHGTRHRARLHHRLRHHHRPRHRSRVSLPGLRHHDDRHLGRVDPLGNHSGRVSLRGIR
ncbi:hypothetical protein, partial [Streptomyces sp. NPDC020983]|uniref:hypothetical protein n=1 Tax=Streptomyces sp. NPDC020983 TaxID=3365106 RepID=UPI0037878D8E